MSEQTKSFKIYSLELGPMDNFIHIVHDLATNNAAVVDPAWDVDAIFAKLEELGLTLTDILLTHSHDDHINGVDETVRRSNATIHISNNESTFWTETPGKAILHSDGDKLSVGDTEMKWLVTPGHTPGSSCFLLDGHLITGDTLFVFGCGRCDMRGGDPKQMFQTLIELRTRIPKDTWIHTGHNYGDRVESTIGEQVEGNPFMHWDEMEDFIQYRLFDHDKTRDIPYGPVSRQELMGDKA